MLYSKMQRNYFNILLLLKQYTNNLKKNRIVSKGSLHFIGMNLHADPCRLEFMTHSVLKRVMSGLLTFKLLFMFN